MQQNKNIIAIDGPAASGKGTLCRNLALKLNFSHMDTGALYRAVAYEMLQHNLNPENESQAVQASIILQQRFKNEGVSTILGSVLLRTDIVASMASRVASQPKVRANLVNIQKNFAHFPPKGTIGSILDGRDIGTIICPDAPLKLYITADLEIRAERRRKELQSKGINATYEAVLEDMRARDARDSAREAAPLRPAEDAIILDSTHLTEAEMLEIGLKNAIKALGLTNVSGA